MRVADLRQEVSKGRLTKDGKEAVNLLLTLLNGAEQVDEAVLQLKPPSPVKEKKVYEMTIVIKNVDTDQVIYTKGARMEPSLLAKMQVSCEAYAAQEGIRVPNPAYDPGQPISDTNQEEIYPTGAQAVTLSIKQFLSNNAIGYESRQAEPLVAAARNALKEKIDLVELI